MTAVLGRMRALFLRPATAAGARGGGGRAEAVDRAAPTTIGVLVPPAHATVAGAVVALAAARRAAAPCAVVSVWRGDGPSAGEPAPGRDAERGGGFAVASARRLALRLARRGAPARARGRLVLVDLPPEPVAARALAERVAAAAGDAPVVTVVAAAREAALDGLLAAQDRLLVVPPPGELEDVGRLAAQDAARIARGVGVLRLPAGGAPRATAACGLLLSGRARAAALDALDGHER